MSLRYQDKEKEFLLKAREIHGDFYNYTIEPFPGMTKKMKIGCKKHGVFKQRPTLHVWQRQGCPKCAIDRRTISLRLGKDEFVRRTRTVC